MRRRVLAGLLVFYAALVVLLVIAPQVLASRATASVTPVTCTGTLAHALTANITVPVGAVCRVSGSTVDGSVTVERDAYFEASDTKITGSIHATAALTVFLHDQAVVTGNVLVDRGSQVFLYKTTVGGVVTITGAVAQGFGHVQVCETSARTIEVTASGPDVLVGDPEGGCPGNQVKQDVSVVGNIAMSELGVSGNVIAGSLTVSGNAGQAPKKVVGNAVQGAVQLSNNALPFDASNNGAPTG